MRAKTAELLYMLMWGAETTFARPALRFWTESFEEWTWRSGVYRYLARLERQELLEHQAGPTAERVYRLTDKGRVRALGGRDPLHCWNRDWDGRWRLIVFDLPEKDRRMRLRLRRFLREAGFGCLQKSVWITPHPLNEVQKELSGFGEDVQSLITFEARAGAGEPDKAIVASSWDFAEINRRYERCLAVLDDWPRQRRFKAGCLPPQLLAWARQEYAAWLDAVSADPLLPTILWPAGYLGQRIWNRRNEVLAAFGKLVRDIPIK